MIDLFTWKTPNGHKAAIMLEECELPYHLHTIDLSHGEQYHPSFLRISPHSKIPAIIDRDAEGGPLSIFESGAILIYLADKVGKFLPREPHARSQVLQWLMFQVGGPGPIFLQTYHFLRVAPERIPYVTDYFLNESMHQLLTLESQFKQRAYIAGEYSIADIALYPWVDAILPLLSNTGKQAQADQLVHTHRWLAEVSEREAVQRGMNIPEEYIPADAIMEETS